MDVRTTRDRDEVEQALALREQVFCVEQGVALEADLVEDIERYAR